MGDFQPQPIVRVIVVDPHPVTRLGFIQLLASDTALALVGEVTSAADCRSLVATEQVDVVTMDMYLPDADGIVLARELRDRYAHLGIVILTSASEDDVLFRALDSGASAFVNKSAPVAELLSAVRHAASSAASFTATGLPAALRRREQSKTGVLSPREREVVQLLAEGRSIPNVATILYVSVSTAKTHVARLYDKLGADNRAQALMVAVRLGLITEPIEAKNRRDTISMCG